MTSDEEFNGSARFRVEERLGQGGMGVVYRAFDCERRMSVALKTIRRPSPSAILRFKQEFRSLADVSHPNLVTLYELVLEQQRYFFTMELLSGVNLIRHVWGEESPSTGLQTVLDLTQPPAGQTVLDTLPIRGGSPPRPEETAETVEEEWDFEPAAALLADQFHGEIQLPSIDYLRLRSAMRQLVEGVQALHRSGHLHRDIKPSNVVVTSEHRVVLLDFGVIARVSGPDRRGSPGDTSGTPRYMAPEVTAGDCSSQASDWYSVGVMLYLALTGQYPFGGDIDLMRKVHRYLAPPQVSRLNPGCPRDLADLCEGLLRIQPEGRPTVQQIQLVLGETGTIHDVRPAEETPDLPPLVVGRKDELQQLTVALKQTRERQSGMLVLLHGESGIGKTTLVRHFLGQADVKRQVLVLAGRCYERESLPYNAIDAVIDTLAPQLSALEPDQLQELLPDDMPLLGRLFPVLGQLCQDGDDGVLDLPRQEVRRRALAALRELLRRLGQLVPLVLFIDDAQWSDEDSIGVLRTLLHPPNEPALLLLLACRSDEAQRGPLMAALQPPGGEQALPATLTIHLQALTEQHGRALARELLGPDGQNSPECEAIAKESGGNPFFIQELVRYQRMVDEQGTEQGHEQERETPDLGAMIGHRVAQLEEIERYLMQLICIADQPLPQRVVQRALVIDDRTRAEMFPRLQTSQLVRLSGRRDADLIEPYHDQIRKKVAASLTEDVLRSHHLTLASILLDQEHPDPEMAARHFFAGGQPGQAARHVLRAAEQAEQSLAFMRAAGLYRWALQLQPSYAEGPSVATLTLKLAGVLAAAGHGSEAAQCYLRAAELVASTVEAREHRHRAAELLLRAGHVDRGLDLLQQVLGSEGLSLPRTTREALASLVWHRARVRLSGLRFRAKPRHDARMTRLADLCHTVSSGLVMLDNIRGADFQARGLLFARRSGDPWRFCRSLTLEAGFASTAETGQKRCRLLLKQARAMADGLDDPYLDALVTGVEGISAFQVGRWMEGYTLNARAEELMQRSLTGVAWELDMTRLFKVWSLVFLGRFAELSVWVSRYIEEATDRGDIYAATNMRTSLSNLVWLMQDDVEQARRQAAEAIDAWSRRRFFMQHFYDLLARGNIELYCGQGHLTHELIDSSWPRVRSVMLNHIQRVRIALHEMHARGLLSEAAALRPSHPRRKALLARASDDARKLAREAVAWSGALSLLIQGQVAAANNDRDGARRLLQRGLAAFDSIDMAMHREVTRLRLGQLLGGEQGQQHTERALQYIRQQGIVEPLCMARVFAPYAAAR